MLQLSSAGPGAGSFPRRIARRALLAGACVLGGAAGAGAADSGPVPAASSVLAQAGASAASALKRMSVEELLAQNVESVSRRPESWGEAPGNVFLITSRAPGVVAAKSLPEVLRLATNLFVAQSSSSSWAINARGFVRSNSYSNKLLVMIDGRTVYSPLFSNVFWDSTSVFIPDLDRVEVISGPAGVTWGANAVNGVINIQSKSARDTLGSLVSLSGGTEARTFGVRHGAKFGTDGAVRVYVQGADYDATRNAAGAEDDLDPWRSLQAGFRADWGRADTGEFTVQGDGFAGRFKNGPAPETRNDNANLLVRWARDLSPDSHLWVRLYHDYSQRDTQSLITEISRATDFEFQHRLDFASHQELLWGADYRLLSDSVQHTVGFAILPPKLDFALGSVFAQHTLPLGATGLRLTTGYRLEHNHFSGWESQPTLRLAWQRPRRTLWLSASRATRIPSRLDTGFYLPATPPYVAAGGPDFNAEIVHAYEVGWRSRPNKDLAFTATLFYHDYDRLRSVEFGRLPAVVSNGNWGRSHGVEAFVDWDAVSWWRMRVGGFVVTQRTGVKVGRTDTERGLGESSFPDYQLQVRNTFRFGDKATLWTGVRHTPDVPGFENGVASLVPAYTEADASLTWRVRSDLEVALSGRNLLHSEHAEIGANATRRQIPRSVQGSLRWSF